MEPAIKAIVDTHVRFNNRKAIEDLLMHRQRLAIDLKGRTAYDFSRPIEQIDGEIAVIEAALRQLAGPDRTAATPHRVSFAAC